MKTITKFFAYFFLFLFITSSAVFGMDNESFEPSINLSDTVLEDSKQAEFFDQVANDDEIIHLVSTTALQKGRDVSVEGVHAHNCIKLYGLKNSEYPLKSVCDTYDETGKLQDAISEDYALLVLYVNENDEFVDTFMFMQKENMPEAADINGWIPLASGGLLGDDESIVEYPEDGNLINVLGKIGLNDTEVFKFISNIPQFSQCIFFVKNGVEFLIPFYDGYAGIQAYSVYKASDIVETYLKPILEFQIEQAEELRDENGDLPYGLSQVPDDLPIQNAVDLNSYYSESREEADTTDVQPQVPENNNTWIIWVAVAVAAIIAIIIIVLIVKKKKR
ncbi:MAG: hypothetical protein IK102_05465 [Treponema sp.]|nr:hypothetical protein [Treponema sp.]